MVSIQSQAVDRAISVYWSEIKPLIDLDQAWYSDQEIMTALWRLGVTDNRRTLRRLKRELRKWRSKGSLAVEFFPQYQYDLKLNVESVLTLLLYIVLKREIGATQAVLNINYYRSRLGDLIYDFHCRPSSKADQQDSIDVEARTA